MNHRILSDLFGKIEKDCPSVRIYVKIRKEIAHIHAHENVRLISAALIGERYPISGIRDILLMVITIIICPSSAHEYTAVCNNKVCIFFTVTCTCLQDIHIRAQ